MRAVTKPAFRQFLRTSHKAANKRSAMADEMAMGIRRSAEEENIESSSMLLDQRKRIG